MASRTNRRQRSRMRHHQRFALLQPSKQISRFYSGCRRERRSFNFPFQPDKRSISRAHYLQLYVRFDMSSTSTLQVRVGSRGRSRLIHSDVHGLSRRKLVSPAIWLTLLVRVLSPKSVAEHFAMLRRIKTSMHRFGDQELRLKFPGRPGYFQSSRKNPVFFISSTKLLS